MSLLEQISTALQKGKAKDIKELVQQAIDQNIPAETILNDGLMAGMNVIGGKFKRNEVFVPEVLVAGRAMNIGTAMLKPLLVKDGVKNKGKVVIGTVKGDLHDIGKNLVRMMIEAKGFEVIDLGVDVPGESFLKTAQDSQVDIVCLSALLTTTMNEMRNVVELFEGAGVRERFKIMIGGAPITQSFCTTIGADIYTPDAASAADAAMGLVAEAA
ncbi:MAG: corrinoid protein [Propionivibrio sp.]|jgi:corrinoid protein of di/trimethylamine methyltransferase|uniref:cobalamin B12-binding domain-containing protein n=1 Tax=Propionivibrio sp. TaxID=2212460 RepID=UPI001B7C5DDB|nr:corrinoid protein [Propionivibrio sp.]MBP7203500.1 corrinoid protein [Propionivibrio sp.]